MLDMTDPQFTRISLFQKTGYVKCFSSILSIYLIFNIFFRTSNRLSEAIFEHFESVQSDNIDEFSSLFYGEHIHSIPKGRPNPNPLHGKISLFFKYKQENFGLAITVMASPMPGRLTLGIGI